LLLSQQSAGAAATGLDLAQTFPSSPGLSR
jgi:hypothetical protein